MEKGEAGPSQLKKRKIKRGPKIVELSRVRIGHSLRSYLLKRRCILNIIKILISTTISLNDAGHYCEISDHFAKRNVQHVRSWFKRQSKNKSSSVNGRFRVKTTEVRRVHVHSSLLVVTSNQNASNKKKNRLNIYPKPGMSLIYPVW